MQVCPIEGWRGYPDELPFDGRWGPADPLESYPTDSYGVRCFTRYVKCIFIFSFLEVAGAPPASPWWIIAEIVREEGHFDILNLSCFYCNPIIAESSRVPSLFGSPPIQNISNRFYQNKQTRCSTRYYTPRSLPPRLGNHPPNEQTQVPPHLLCLLHLRESGCSTFIHLRDPPPRRQNGD